jgi:hypothetical protein
MIKKSPYLILIAITSIGFVKQNETYQNKVLTDGNKVLKYTIHFDIPTSWVSGAGSNIILGSFKVNNGIDNANLEITCSPSQAYMKDHPDGDTSSLIKTFQLMKMQIEKQLTQKNISPNFFLKYVTSNQIINNKKFDLIVYEQEIYKNSSQRRGLYGITKVYILKLKENIINFTFSYFNNDKENAQATSEKYKSLESHMLNSIKVD